MDWDEILDELQDNLETICPKCVQCGYCCKHTPCYYGKWDNEKQQCIYLTEDNLCGIYDKIIELEKDIPKSERMFGTECCLKFMNPERLQKLQNK